MKINTTKTRVVSISMLILTIILITVLLSSLTSCNKDMFDTVYEYDYATVLFPGDTEVTTIYIKQWKDYSDSEQIQIIATDGTVYLVSSYNCVLIRKP